MSRTLRAAYLAATLAVVTSVSHARADECANAETQGAMNECYANIAKKSDTELNQLYHQVTARLTTDPDTTKLLVAVQRAWIGFRDAECGFRSSGVGGGSASSMIYSMCIDGLTRRRIQDFKGYLNCPEGDLSCPLPPAN